MHEISRFQALSLLMMFERTSSAISRQLKLTN